MGSVEVVVMQPQVELLLSLLGVLVSASVGPLADGGLDKSLRFSIGARSIGSCEAMPDVLLAQCLPKRDAAVARAIIGEHALDGEAEAGEVRLSQVKEARGRLMGLIGHEGREADPGVVIDGHMQILPAGTARPFLRLPGNAAAGLADAGQTLDIEVDHVAGVLVFVAHHGRRRVQRGQAVEPGAAQDAADRGPAGEEQKPFPIRWKMSGGATDAALS